MTRYLFLRALREPQQVLYVGIAMIAFAFLPQWAVYFGLPILLLNALFLPERANLFEATLPINTREIVLARLMSITLVTIAPLLVWLIAMPLWLARNPAELLSNDAFGPLYWTNERIVEVTLAVVILTALPFSVRPNELSAPPIFPVLRLWAVCGTVCALVIAFLPSATALLVLLFFVTATLHRVSSVVPEGMQALSLDVDEVTVPSKWSQRLNAGPSHVKSRWLWPIFRSSVPLISLPAPLLLLFIAAIGSNPVLLALLLNSNSAMTRGKISWLARLPISARARLLMMLAPTLFGVLCFTIGAGFAEIVASSRLLGDQNSIVQEILSSRRSLSRNAPRVEDDIFDSPASIPLEYWSLMSTDSVPVVVAPWGEPVKVFTISAGPLTLYNPYTSRKSSSRAFAEWQFGRATARIFGQAITWKIYRQGGLRLTKQDPSHARFVISCAFWLIYALLMALVTESVQRPLLSGSRWSQYLLGGVTVIPVFVLLAVDFKFEHTMFSDFGAAFGSYLLMQLTQSLRSNLMIIVPVLLAVVVILFMLIERKFRENEVAGILMSPEQRARVAAIRARILARGH